MTMMEELQKKRTREEMLEDFIAAYDYLKSHKDCNGQVGCCGILEVGLPI
jgi:carboxymethylenebutenolidase